MPTSLECTVISYVPFRIHEEKPGLIPPRFVIPASDGKTPKLLRIGTATHFVYLDEARGNLQVKNPPDVVARAIVDDYCKGQLGIDDESGPALFWIPGTPSLEEIQEEFKVEIVKQLRKQKRWFVNIIKIAKDDWVKYHQHNVISDTQRRIAEILQLDPRENEWMAPGEMLKETTKKCRYCQSQIDKEAALCSVCGKIADVELYKKLEHEDALVKG